MLSEWHVQLKNLDFFVLVFGPKRTHFLAFSSLLLYRSTETHYVYVLNIKYSQSNKC